MSLILTDVAKSFGDTQVLHYITFTVNRNDRIGLIGANGAGKSTLLRMIAGEIAPDSGRIELDAQTQLGYLAQSMGDEQRSVGEMLDDARSELAIALQQMRLLEIAMAQADADIDQLLAEYALASATFERLGGYAVWETEAILDGLGIGTIERSRPTSTLSGGEKARLALAILLMQSPDLLLLDEPTNHLDFSALAWLEEYLAARAGALIVVSHDRHFLDRTVNRIVEIDDHTHEGILYSGNYSTYAEEKRRSRLRAEEAYQAEQEEVRALRKFIKTKGRQVAHNRPPKDNDGFIPFFKAGRVEATISRNLHAAEEKLARIEANPLPKPPKPIVINPDFKPEIFGSKQPLVASGISHGYGARQLLTDVDLTVQRRDRVVIVGENGTGKSTLLRILAGDLTPDEGHVYTAPGVVIGHLDQEQETLSMQGTLYESYADGQVGDFETLKTALLSTGLFAWDELNRPVSALSVGQRRKLQLAKLLAKHANVLLLDEPTNHISLDVLEEFEEALGAFDGPIVAISHDRRFIERFGGELWQIENAELRRTQASMDILPA